jgi:glycosyltransferase involved in cell wall biosynthesis
LAQRSEVEVSVVVPTHNRRVVLEEVIAALEAQESAPSFELIVIDDGSSDGTAEWLARRDFKLPTVVHRQPNGGPAAARNQGVALAGGEIVAFLGDDTVPDPAWLARHWHAQQSVQARASCARGEWVGVIGYTAWHPRMRLNPFLRYINEYGLQFGYALIEDADDVPFNFLYTSNLSLPRAALLAEPFDLGFPYAAWEDIELSYRLKKRGFRLLYEEGARVSHDHPTDIARFCRRQERAGYCAVVFYRRHPELGSFLGLGPQGPPPLPSGWRRRLAGLAGLVARGLQNLPVHSPRLWEDVLRGSYIEGLHRGWREGAGLGSEGGQTPRGVGRCAQQQFEGRGIGG